MPVRDEADEHHNRFPRRLSPGGYLLAVPGEQRDEFRAVVETDFHEAPLRLLGSCGVDAWTGRQRELS